ncbi:MAG: hypothetical protein Q9200_003536 [Gallowayella weberi]
MDLRHVSSRELAGQTLSGYSKREITYENLTPDDVRRMEEGGRIDCWVMALPNGVCKPFVDAIDEASSGSSVIVDLSADYRFSPDWTYGLPELVNRATIAKAKRISNPGCYATAAQVGIAPLVEHLASEQQPSVFGTSGYSGAGTKPSPKNNLNNLRDNLIPYSLTGHHSINIPLSSPLSARDIRNLYQERYAGEPLVRITGEAPNVKNIAGKHHIEIGGFAIEGGRDRGKRVVVCVTIDNLLKGAATQCAQNMNLALGFAEFEGIPLEGRER